MRITKWGESRPSVRARDRKDKDRKTNQWFSDRIKLKAVNMWIQTGNLSLVAKEMNIPYHTVRTWRYYTDWWDPLVQEIIGDRNQKKDAKLETLIENTYNQLDDRIENGDLVLNSATGEIVRIPMKGKDLATISKSLHQQQQELLEVPTKMAAQEATSEMLADLAKQFAKIAGKTGGKEKVLPAEEAEVVEFVERVDETINADS